MKAASRIESLAPPDDHTTEAKRDSFLLRKRLMLARRARQFRKLMKLLPIRDCRRGLRHNVAASVEHLSLIKGINIATLIDLGSPRQRGSVFIAHAQPASIRSNLRI